MWDWVEELLGVAGDAASDSEELLWGASGLSDNVVDALPDLASDLGDLGSTSEWFLDTATGELVTGDEMQALMDLDVSGSGSGPVGDVLGPDWDPLDLTASSTSTSDMLRSLQADPQTFGSEPFDWTKMADPSSITSGGGFNWMKPLLEGAGNLLKGLGGGPGGSGGGSGGGIGLAGGGLGSLVAPGFSSPTLGTGSADRVGAGAAGGVDGIGGLSGLAGLAATSPLAAALSKLQADAQRLGLQGPIDAGPAPLPFKPLAIPPATAGGSAVSPAMQQRLSGLQRLLSERLG